MNLLNFVLIFASIYVVKGVNNNCTFNCALSIMEKSRCKPSKTCGRYSLITLSNQQKRFIVENHNLFRNRASQGENNKMSWPSASNMMEIQYAPSYDIVVKCAAYLCDDYQYHGIIYDEDGKQMSFNVYEKTGKVESTEFLIHDAIVHWYESIGECGHDIINDYQGNGSYFENLCSPFTQLVWAKTSYVACSGMNYVYKGQEKNILYCFYFPPGNIPGEMVYSKGFPASECPDSKISNAYTSLCASKLRLVSDDKSIASIKIFSSILFVGSLIINFYIR